MSSRTIRVLLEYDGGPFLGWQTQPQGPTVQSTLERALERITGESTRVQGSGRTDAGVHALGQIASFRTSSALGPDAFARALNAVLPASIAVLDADEVPEEFDARYSAAGKTYRYRILNRRAPSPFELRRSWLVHSTLDIESIIASCDILIGIKDFSSFRATGCSAKSPVRNMRRCSLEISGDVLVLEFEADGFLRHMVRNIVGTLVDVGRGRFSPEGFGRILEARDRARAGVAAPPWGLYLVRVDYPTPFAPLAGNHPTRHAARRRFSLDNTPGCHDNPTLTEGSVGA